MPEVTPRFNIAPSSKIIAIRDINKGRTGSWLRWGLVPPTATDAAKMPMLNNARSETVAEKPMFKHAFHRRRCIIPVSGFYEWHTVPGEKTKQPFYITTKDGSPMSFAGIWETSRIPDGNGYLETCTILTTGPNAVMEAIHDRMPVILEREHWDLWLTTDIVPPGQLTQLLKPCAPDLIIAQMVSDAVNRISNDSPALIEARMF